MNTVEEDAAHVRAVAAALRGPQTVYVLMWDDKDDNGAEIFATDRGARDNLLKWLDIGWERDFALSQDQYVASRVEIDEGRKNHLNNDNDIWLSIYRYEVRP